MSVEIVMMSAELIAVQIVSLYAVQHVLSDSGTTLVSCMLADEYVHTYLSYRSGFSMFTIADRVKCRWSG